MPESIQDLWDVWHQPFLGAIHVMGIAWFGASLFVEAPKMRRLATAWMLLTGIALFLLNPARIEASTAFRIKMGIVGAIVLAEFLSTQPRWLMLTLWMAAIFFARAIAYF